MGTLIESGKWFPLCMNVSGLREKERERDEENIASTSAEVQMAVPFTVTQSPLPYEGEPTVTTLSLLPTCPYTEPSLVVNFSPGCQFFLLAKRQPFAHRTHRNTQTMHMGALLTSLRSPLPQTAQVQCHSTAFHGMCFLVGSQTQPIPLF